MEEEQQPVAAKVKPLEWEGAPAGRERYGMHEFGYYIITRKAPCYVVSTFTNKGAMRNVGQARDLEKAYEIAETDYERRMLASLAGYGNG